MEEPTVQNPSPDEIAEKLASRIVKGKEILKRSESLILNALKIDGKTLKEWADELRIDLPEGDDIQGLEQASTKIGVAIQKAEYILAIFDLQASVASHYHEEGFSNRYVYEMQNDKKLAADKIKHLASINTNVDSSLAAAQAAKVISEFFKRIVKGLEEVRKGIENRTKLIQVRVYKLNDF